MKRILSLLFFAIALFGMSQTMMAQMPEVSTADNPKWYFIENGNNFPSEDPTIIADNVTRNASGDITGSDGRFCALLTGSASSHVTTQMYYLLDENRDLQLWRLEKDANGNYNFINKKTNQKLAYAGTGEKEDRYFCTGVNTTPASFILTQISGSPYLTILNSAFGADVKNNRFFIAGASTTGVNYAAIDGAAADVPVARADKLVCSPIGWNFVLQEDLEKQYPKAGKWYQLVNTSVNKALSVEDEGLASLMVDVAPSDGSGSECAGQIFQIETTAADFFQLKSLKTKTYLGNEFIFEIGERGWTLVPEINPYVNFAVRRLNNPSSSISQLNIRMNMRTGPLFRVNEEGAFETEGSNLLHTIENEDGENVPVEYKLPSANWTLLEYTGSTASDKHVAADDVFVYTQDRRVYIKGTDAPLTIYSIAGARVNENAQLTPGAYIVRAADKSFKVLVK